MTGLEGREWKKMCSIAVILSVVRVVMGEVGREEANEVSVVDCNTSLLGITPCVNYITGNVTSPSEGCCGALANAVKNNASCLCQLLVGNQTEFAINQNRATALPGQCNVSPSAVEQCQDSGTPVTNTSSKRSGSPTGQSTRGSNPSQSNSVSSMLFFSVINVLCGMALPLLLI